ncbi:ATP-grasp domain-containing protein [Planococcus dechangensis]|uniref:ATP-grasp domain-containing protein n=1 Tax=Planococcus dechangensis TaxID=1176255 RepID=A0ABV9MCG6_9BACL
MVKQKKLLILGGITHMIDVVETAKNMGLYTIVTDSNKESPAKKFADKSYSISTADIDALEFLAQQEEISGVLTAFDDINTWNAQLLTERLGLPFYATKEHLDISSNKDRFKEFCRRFNVPVIEQYEKDDGMPVRYPVIVKPVDSSASKGITVCQNEAELYDAIDKARRFSHKSRVIVERFIDTNHGVEMYYTLQNGDVILSAVTDRFVHNQGQQSPPLPVATIYPSSHLSEFVAKYDANIREMLSGIGFRNGLVIIQSLYEDGNFYIYEMGYRLSGEQHYQIIQRQTDVNLLEMMIDFAVGEDISRYDLSDFDDGFVRYPSCNLSVLLGPGKIRDINGLSEILDLPSVISWVPIREIGDEITVTGSYSQMLGRFNIVCQTMEELNGTIREINRTLEVISQNGEDMLLARYLAEEKIT